MGWCSGTDVFDPMVKQILKYPADQMTNKVKKELISKLIDVLEVEDWDCQSDSDVYGHYLVQECMRELHPDWFEEEG